MNKNVEKYIKKLKDEASSYKKPAEYIDLKFNELNINSELNKVDNQILDEEDQKFMKTINKIISSDSLQSDKLINLINNNFGEI